jgi:predicted nucleic acid-binding protein
MPERLTFDSEPIIAYFLGEPGGKIVRDYLTKIQKKEIAGFISVINITEVYYILCRMNPSLADESCRVLRQFGLTVIPIEDDDLWCYAAKIKAEHSLSLADAFAVATAEKQKSTLVIGSDKEFNGLPTKLLRMRG